MAYYAALVSVVQLLKDITLHDRYQNFLFDRHQLHVSLYAKFNLLLEMVDDYSPKDHEEESNDILERRIRDAAYCAQDMIESHISTTLVAHIQLEKRTSGVERVRRHLGSTFRKPLDSFAKKKYYRDLEKVEVEVDSVVDELMRIKAVKNTVHDDLQPNSYISVEESRVQAASCKNTMLVFDENLMKTIKAQLSGQSSKLEVISIVGMGGLGKTTLAKNIFDGKLVYDRFDYRVWITVSQDYHLKTILWAIVNSLNINKEELDKVGEEVLRQNIYQNLFGRRYFIVLDDLWETTFWDDISRIFPDNSNGSRIMITTRISDVADYISNSTFLHQMSFLDEDQSWTLLREKVFAQEHCPNELKVIGKLIARDCGGLPLAIVVIAGVISNVKRAQHDWENIARKVSSTVIDQNDGHLSTILSMSYNQLPHHLKPCFLYMGGYPKDYNIRISELIRLWVAEGFLKPIESKSLEEVGEEYFKDLVNRNLVLATGKKSDGRFKFCFMHDILREMCSQRAHHENFLLCVRRKDDFQRVPISNVHRVYVQPLVGYSKIHKYIKKHGSHVRSLISYFPETCYGDESLSAASSCKLLRILDTIPFSPSTAFDKLTELLHLRYVKHYAIILFPSRIFHLQNLQTIICRSNMSLPSEIWQMPQLRHVISKWGVKLPPIPDEIERKSVPLLRSLQTLSIAELRHSTYTRAIFEIPNIKKLGLRCRSTMTSTIFHIWGQHELSNLVHLHKLETLIVVFDSFPISVLPHNPLPESFTFPSTLIKLTLVNGDFPWENMSVVGSLPNLQVLKLRENAFGGSKWEPIEGQFLKLKFLEMKSFMELKYWRAESTHFPRLERLHIIWCNELEEIPPGIGDIPTLQLIHVVLGTSSPYMAGNLCANRALASSALEIQQQQQDLGNDDLQVLVQGWR